MILHTPASTLPRRKNLQQPGLIQALNTHGFTLLQDACRRQVARLMTMMEH